MNLNRIQHKQQEVAAVAGVSSNTLRNVYKELKYMPPPFFIFTLIHYMQQQLRSTA
jgi:DNA-binding XRE family transcriptional regulator